MLVSPVGMLEKCVRAHNLSDRILFSILNDRI